MEDVGLPLLVHASRPTQRSTSSTGEGFIEETLGPTARALHAAESRPSTSPRASRRCSTVWRSPGSRTRRQPLSAHHLLMTPNALFMAASARHHYSCRCSSRGASRALVDGGHFRPNPKVLLRHRQRTHARSAKEAACGCAGIYTAPRRLELYAIAFEEAQALEQSGGVRPRQYGAACLTAAATTPAASRWCARSGLLPETLAFGGDRLVPPPRRRNDSLKLA